MMLVLSLSRSLFDRCSRFVNRVHVDSATLDDLCDVAQVARDLPGVFHGEAVLGEYLIDKGEVNETLSFLQGDRARG